MPLSRLESLPPGGFRTKAPQGMARRRYPRHDATEMLVKDTIKVLGLTPFRLAAVLDIHCSAVYRWVKGETRPCMTSGSRMQRLLAWKLQGLDVARMKRINWDEGFIEWWEFRKVV